jgi:O-antigen/teichoic acid export membrane protein
MKAERLARSGSYSLFGSSFAAIAAFGLTVLVANGLGAYGTGLFFQAMGLFTIASQVFRLGTNSSIVKLISEQRAFGREGEAWRSVWIALVPVIVVSSAAAICLRIFAQPLADWLGSTGEQDALAELLRDMAPFVVLASVLAVLSTATRMLRGVEAFTLLQSVLSPLSRLLLVALAIALSWDALGAFRAWLIAIPIWLIVTAVVLWRPLVTDWRRRHTAQESTKQAIRSFWGFSSTRAVGAAFETALEWSDVIIVAALSSPTAAGVYAVATRMVRAGQVVDAAMRVAVGPTISQLLARSNFVAARDLNTSITKATILSNWPFYLILATMGPALLELFGPEFIDGSVVLAILAGAMMVSAAAGMLQTVLLQGGRSSWQMGNKGLALGLSIGLNLLLIPILGILGAALTWTAVILVETALASWQVHTRMRVRMQPRKLLLAMAIPLVMFGGGGILARVTFGSSFAVLLVATVVLSGIYLVLLWWLRERLGIVSLWREIPYFRRFADRAPTPLLAGSVSTDEAEERTA